MNRRLLTRDQCQFRELDTELRETLDAAPLIDFRDAAGDGLAAVATMMPFTTIGFTRLAVKGSPTWLRSEESGWFTRTVKKVPGAMVSIAGSGGGGGGSL